MSNLVNSYFFIIPSLARDVSVCVVGLGVVVVVVVVVVVDVVVVVVLMHVVEEAVDASLSDMRHTLQRRRM